jgi:hypothetical protein
LVFIAIRPQHIYRADSNTREKEINILPNAFVNTQFRNNTILVKANLIFNLFSPPAEAGGNSKPEAIQNNQIF